MSNDYCLECQNTGYALEPTYIDAFDREFDRLYDMGILEGYICYRRACEATGYRKIPCPKCERGKEIQEKNDQ